MNEINYEENLVTDNSIIIVPRYFELFDCGRNFLIKFDATCKWACMETPKESYNYKVIKYQQTRIVESKESIARNLVIP